jgi:hypothetical protein
MQRTEPVIKIVRLVPQSVLVLEVREVREVRVMAGVK